MTKKSEQIEINQKGNAQSLNGKVAQTVVKRVIRRPTLEEMLRAFDPKRHGGEAMATESLKGEFQATLRGSV
ncbi:MAG: hypothetical protein V4787_16785 [Pseudomonadota bacterium]